MNSSLLPANGSPAEPTLGGAVPALASAGPAPSHTELVQAVHAHLGDRLVVLVGLMASGKTSVGRLLAQRLHLPFVDADHEIETAAQMSVPEIFAKHGEADFRSGERRVIARILREGPRVLATGGGAFMNAETRDAIRARGISVWLRADLDTLLRRTRRRGNRPLLQTGDPEATMRKLIEVRYPIYAEADLTVDSIDGPHEGTADLILQALLAHVRQVAVGHSSTPDMGAAR